MDDTITIRDGGNSLELSAPTLRDGEGWTWYTAVLTAPGLRATTTVADFGRWGIERYFAELCASWRGWEGEKSWLSTENHLAFAARIDRTGHITLKVTLWDDAGSGGWRAECELAVEAGEQLSRIGSDVARLFGGTRA